MMLRLKEKGDGDKITKKKRSQPVADNSIAI